MTASVLLTTSAYAQADIINQKRFVEQWTSNLPDNFDGSRPVLPSERKITRRALVIGNWKYPGDVTATGYKLENVANDITNAAPFLRDEHGYEVSAIDNFATLNGFYHDINPFIRSIDPGDFVLIYYSGHGLNWNGRPMMVPLEASKDIKEHEARSTHVDLDYLIGQIWSTLPSHVLVIFDACRTETQFRILDETGEDVSKSNYDQDTVKDRRNVDTNWASTDLLFASKRGTASSIPSAKGAISYYTDGLLNRSVLGQRIEEAHTRATSFVSDRGSDQLPSRVQWSSAVDARISRTPAQYALDRKIWEDKLEKVIAMAEAGHQLWANDCLRWFIRENATNSFRDQANYILQRNLLIRTKSDNSVPFYDEQCKWLSTAPSNTENDILMASNNELLLDSGLSFSAAFERVGLLGEPLTESELALAEAGQFPSKLTFSVSPVLEDNLFDISIFRELTERREITGQVEPFSLTFDADTNEAKVLLPINEAWLVEDLKSRSQTEFNALPADARDQVLSLPKQERVEALRISNLSQMNRVEQ